jgi:hypothetical protein
MSAKMRSYRLASTNATFTIARDEETAGGVNAEAKQRAMEGAHKSSDEESQVRTGIASSEVAAESLESSQMAGIINETNNKDDSAKAQSQIEGMEEHSTDAYSSSGEESTETESSTHEYSTDTDSSSESGTSDADRRTEYLYNTPAFNDGRHVSCIQEAQLSPDGTCIFTSDCERAFSVYPTTTRSLVAGEIAPMKPYARFQTATPIWSFTVNPFFDYQDSNTTTVLVSCRDQYITLHNALWDTSQYSNDESSNRTGPVDISNKLASYQLVDRLTEAVDAPLSLAYSCDGYYFYAGHQNCVSIFDLNNKNDPITKIRTIPSKNTTLKGGGRGFKGHITALAVSSPSTFHGAGILAAGSRTSFVGLYDGVGGEEITSFALPSRSIGGRHNNGKGVTSVKWSSDSNYLYVAERNSDDILIYDARNFSLNLGYCAGRAALTNQKLGFDLYSSADVYGKASQEVWAGGTDGKIRVWRDPQLKEGRAEADKVLEVNEWPVVGTLVHENGGMVVAASGTQNRGCLDILAL